MGTYMGWKIEVAGMRPIRWKLKNRKGVRYVPYYYATKRREGQADWFVKEETLKEIKARIREEEAK